MNIKWAQHVQELLKRGRPEDLVQSLEAPREQKTSFQRALSRRNFVRTAAGAAGAGVALGSGLLSPSLALADDDGIPNPISHLAHFAPLGLFDGPFHSFFPGPVDGSMIADDPLGTQANGRDPSTIFDFCGSIAAVDVRGGATGINTVTNATTPYTYHTDLRAFRGRFIGTDGEPHEGTLCFI